MIVLIKHLDFLFTLTSKVVGRLTIRAVPIHAGTGEFVLQKNPQFITHNSLWKIGLYMNWQSVANLSHWFRRICFTRSFTLGLGNLVDVRRRLQMLHAYCGRFYFVAMMCISFTAPAQIWTDTIPDWNHEDIAKIKIQYKGQWNHMSGGGSYPENDEAYAVYNFWGHAIEIYTELASHHGSYIVDIDNQIQDTILVRNSTFAKDTATYRKYNLYYGNHRILLRRHDGPFVLDKFVTWTDSDPYPQCPEYPFDLRDSIDWNIIKKDSIDWNIVKKDSAVTVPVYDSVPYRDTLPPVYGDIILSGADTQFPELDKEFDRISMRLIVIIIIGGLLILLRFIKF